MQGIGTLYISPGSQSFVECSFNNPLETRSINCMGTVNPLETVRVKDIGTKIVFAGSVEEHGSALSSQEQYEKAKNEYGTIYQYNE
jgi:GDPmannose 4,6-dehydratase